MTPAEHIAMAEGLIEEANRKIDGGWPESARHELLAAITHALIAIAVEGGVPHATVPPAGT